MTYDPVDANDDGIVESDVDNESVSTENILHEAVQLNEHASDKRPLISTEPRTMHVAPSGSDDAEGTQADPLSLSGAFGEIPLVVQHETVIDLADGTYLSGGGEVWTAPGHIAGGINSDMCLRMEGNLSDNTAVQIDGVIKWGVTSNEFDNPSIKNITFTNFFENFNGDVRLSNCRFSGVNNSTNVAMSPHNAGTTYLDNCKFVAGSGLDYAGVIKDSHEVIVIGCSGETDKHAFDVGNAGQVNLTFGNDSLTGRLGFVTQSGNGQFFTSDGCAVSADARLTDDWGDGRLSGRFKSSTALHRPEWDVQDGSPSAGNGHLSLPAGDVTTQALRSPAYLSRMTTGEWLTRLSAESTPSTGEFRHSLYSDGTGNFVYLKLTAGGTASIVEYDGAFNTVVNGSWPADTAEHEFRAVRSTDIDGNGNEGWGLFVDGVSQGTATTTFVVPPKYRAFRNTLDSEIRVKQIYERPE